MQTANEIADVVDSGSLGRDSIELAWVCPTLCGMLASKRSWFREKPGRTGERTCASGFSRNQLRYEPMNLLGTNVLQLLLSAATERPYIWRDDASNSTVALPKACYARCPNAMSLRLWGRSDTALGGAQWNRALTRRQFVNF